MVITCSTPPIPRNLKNAGERLKPTSYGPKTATGSIRRHFFSKPDVWIRACDEAGFEIRGKEAEEAEKFCSENNTVLTKAPQKGFTYRLLQDCVIHFIVQQDQALRIVDTESFRTLILVLRDTLSIKEIPQLDDVTPHGHGGMGDLHAALRHISLTSDGATDRTLYPFVGLTAHWVAGNEITDQKLIKAYSPSTHLVLKSAVIGY
ncbi:hypothetical protein AAF712_016424 [Marasmius tenuissimus]|uniref:Uncharacterized protein n=1 Tax=Marasmius tenuissimus TaxID=585030 RepID=A0ABR2Z7Y4_9AGAR